MAYYSFVVLARQPVGFPKPMVMLDAGMNVFSAEVEDIALFSAQLKEEGVTVQQMNRLDAHEPGNPSDIVLEGDPPLFLGGNDGVST